MGVELLSSEGKVFTFHSRMKEDFHAFFGKESEPCIEPVTRESSFFW